MLDLLKTEIGKKYKLLSNKWVFFSFFDKNGSLLFSKGMVEVDKSLGQIVDILYHNFFQKIEWDCKLAVVDIVTNLEELYSYEILTSIDFTKNGIAVQQLEWELWWVVLPNTEGIADIKQLFTIIKKKNLLNGNIKVFLFQTDRLVIEIPSR